MAIDANDDRREGSERIEVGREPFARRDARGPT
jgi:hypothetical protein